MSSLILKLRKLKELIYTQETLFAIYGSESDLIILKKLRWLYQCAQVDYLRVLNADSNRNTPTYLTMVYTGEQTLDAVLGMS